MAYSSFKLFDIQKGFDLTIDEKTNLFSEVKETEMPPSFGELLFYNLTLANAMDTEKARSELVIAPILVELRKYMKETISFFSGAEFTVDSEKGLSGVCDFLISKSSQIYFIRSPIAAIVEAKNNDINQGLGQCFAEMMAAQIFNEREGTKVPAVYGAVTTADKWKFLKLEGKTAFIDVDDYYLKEHLKKIFGILVYMVA